MSPRYLHKLLEPTGRSFAQHLLQRRLDCAAAMLRDPECAQLKISEVAAQSGFADISHFNLSFCLMCPAIRLMEYVCEPRVRARRKNCSTAAN